MPFQLNGQSFTKLALKRYAEQQLTAELQGWERDLFQFIKDWLSEDEYITVHTSGSTGAPKAIQLNKTQVRNSALMTANYLGLGENSNALLSLSANYIAGKMMIVRAIENEWHLWATEPSNQPLINVAAELQIDLVAWVPSQLQAMLELDDPQLETQIRQIGTIILGGSPVLPQLAQKLESFPNRVFETFGMTETISHIAMRRLSGPDAQDTFETTDADIILGQDDRDCLVIIAPALAHQPVVTNDIVDVKDDRHFRWLGRVDNVVNSGGIKLFPEELERKIQPLIAQRFFLAGVADLQLGQKLILVLEGPPLNPKEVEHHKESLRTALTRYEMPRQIFTVSQFEETATHKVNRTETLKKL
jgi:O-succinylbenzoic acid--CoA ligase